MRVAFTQRSKTPIAVLALLCIATVCACSTFHGPGEFVAGGRTNADSTAAREPAIALNGERVDSTIDPATITFDWPVDEARMTRGFSSVAVPSPLKAKRGRKKAKPRAHWGLDLANRKGTPILASQAGRVVYTGHSFRGYGKLVVVEHSEEWATLYSHLDKILVKEGQTVNQGEKIALMGRTGRATGVHLHFEIRHHRQPVNPLAYLPLGNDRPGFGGYASAPRESLQRMMSQGLPEDQPPTD